MSGYLSFENEAHASGRTRPENHFRSLQRNYFTEFSSSDWNVHRTSPRMQFWNMATGLHWHASCGAHFSAIRSTFSWNDFSHVVFDANRQLLSIFCVNPILVLVEFRGLKSEMRACLQYVTGVHFAETNLSINQCGAIKVVRPSRTNKRLFRRT